MQLFCPACQSAFAGSQRCPRCGGLLLMPHETSAADAPPPKTPAPAAPPAPPMPVGRVFVGAVFALGLYLALRKLAVATVLAGRPDPEAWWGSLEGLTTVGALQMLAVVFGAILAAAGRVVGFMFGATVGGVCGALFLAAELLAGAPPRDIILYAQPLMLVVVGGVAGALSARVWGAVPVLDMPVPDRHKLRSSQFTLSEPAPTGRPTAWARVLVGALVIVVAFVGADQLRKGAQKYSGGLLKADGFGQAQFITWQFAVLGALAGAAAAGATTGAGARHGLFAAVPGALGVLGATAARGEPLSPVSFWLSTLSLGEAAPTDPAAVAATIGGVLFLGLAGGWLGNALFQPLAPLHMRGRLRTGLD